MTDEPTRQTQLIAARIAGFTLLLLMISGLTGMFAFDRHVIVAGDATRTAHNILAHERAFRAGRLCEIFMLNCDVVLALALYALLKPVGATLALLGSFWRIANATLLGVGVASSLVALDMLSNSHYMYLLNADQLRALTLIFFDMHNRLSLMGLMFFCLGAASHSWLLYRSRYIPRVISGLYLFSAIEMLLCCFAFILFPGTRAILDPALLIPDFFAELSAALWLACKGVNLHANLEALR